MSVFLPPATVTNCLQQPLIVSGLMNRVRKKGNILNRYIAIYYKIKLIVLNIVHEVKSGEYNLLLFVSSTGTDYSNRPPPKRSYLAIIHRLSPNDDIAKCICHRRVVSSVHNANRCYVLVLCYKTKSTKNENIFTTDKFKCRKTRH